MTKFVFKGKKVVQKVKGKKVSEYFVFSLVGQPTKGQWHLTTIDSAMRKLAGTFLEDIHNSHHVTVKIYSEPGEVLEDVRTKAIVVEDYSSTPHQIIVVFPHQRIPDERLIDTLNQLEE